VAALSDADRALLAAEMQRNADCPGGVSKAQLRAVVNAIDDWWDATGSVDGNAAIPQPQRGVMTTKQKARVFMEYLRRRYEVT
jgi:hypothetical protein